MPFLFLIQEILIFIVYNIYVRYDVEIVSKNEQNIGDSTTETTTSDVETTATTAITEVEDTFSDTEKASSSTTNTTTDTTTTEGDSNNTTPETDKATDGNGEVTDLPQTGIYSLKTVSEICVSVILMFAGLYLVSRSGIFRKRNIRKR